MTFDFSDKSRRTHYSSNIKTYPQKWKHTRDRQKQKRYKQKKKRYTKSPPFSMGQIS
uniref:Uncharacterized protein n=1 Tax=Anguilla anguilla TaxID=7936 RepID=A0A0E9QCQ8_ANGAN